MEVKGIGPSTIANKVRNVRYPVSAFRFGAFRDKHIALLGSVGESITVEEHCFLQSSGFAKTKVPGIYFSRMFQIAYLVSIELLSEVKFSPTFGTFVNGRWLVARAAKSQYAGPPLEDFLEKDVGPEYFLSSDEAKAKIEMTNEIKGPEYLQKALKPGLNVLRYRGDEGFTVQKDVVAYCLKAEPQMCETYIIDCKPKGSERAGTKETKGISKKGQGV